MHSTPAPSLRARRRTLAPLSHLDIRRMRAPFLTALLLLNTLLPHPVAAAAPTLPTDAATPAALSLQPAEPTAPSATGIASWYGNPRRYGEPAIAWYTRTSPWGEPVEFYAAAGPELRRLLGDQNPYHEHYPVTITNPATGQTIEATVVDWCGCNTGRREKLIDLSPAAFEALGVPLWRGIQRVEVTLGHAPRPAPLLVDQAWVQPSPSERSLPVQPDVSTRGRLAF